MQLAPIANGKTVLIVDDDPNLRQSLGDALTRQEGVETQAAANAKIALEMVKNRRFDAILMDVRLPDMDGREVCRLFRRKGVKVPILMVSVADSEADTILGLDAGANDYITKPFRLDVLRARLRAQLRMHERSDYAVMTVGPYTFHPGRKLLVNPENGRKEHLTEKETVILRYLVKAGGAKVSRADLRSEIWGSALSAASHTVETHVYRLRKKIERDPTNPTVLVTDDDGYRLRPVGTGL